MAPVDALPDRSEDKIIAAITEAIVAAQRDDEDPSSAFVDTTATLHALVEVAARIAFQAKFADTATKGARFAEEHVVMIRRTLNALRKRGDEHPFARVRQAHLRATPERGTWTFGFRMAIDPHERL
jgi:hypothetical protein